MVLSTDSEPEGPSLVVSEVHHGRMRLLVEAYHYQILTELGAREYLPELWQLGVRLGVKLDLGVGVEED